MAKKLSTHGIKIVASGGTAKSIRESGVEVTEVSDITGFPEILGGELIGCDRSLDARTHVESPADAWRRASQDTFSVRIAHLGPNRAAICRFPAQAG